MPIIVFQSTMQQFQNQSKTQKQTNDKKENQHIWEVATGESFIFSIFTLNINNEK